LINGQIFQQNPGRNPFYIRIMTIGCFSVCNIFLLKSHIKHNRIHRNAGFENYLFTKQTLKRFFQVCTFRFLQTEFWASAS